MDIAKTFAFISANLPVALPEGTLLQQTFDIYEYRVWVFEGACKWAENCPEDIAYINECKAKMDAAAALLKHLRAA